MNYSFESCSHRFKFSDAEPLFRILYREYIDGHLKLTDIIPLDYEIKELIYELMDREMKKKTSASSSDGLSSLILSGKHIGNTIFSEKRVFLPDILSGSINEVDVEVNVAPIKPYKALTTIFN